MLGYLFHDLVRSDSLFLLHGTSYTLQQIVMQLVQGVRKVGKIDLNDRHTALRVGTQVFLQKPDTAVYGIG